MSTRTLILGAAAAFSIVAPASAGMPDGWYLSLEGGGNWVQDWDVSPPGTSTGTISFDNGWAALGSVGYGRGRWSAEFEAGYRKNDLDAFTTNDETNPVEALRLEEATFMANLRYSYPLMERLTLSAGAGAGADYAQMKLTSGGFSGEDEDWNFAYQGIAGLSYAVGQRSEIFANYRYFRTTKAAFDFNPQLSAFLDGEEFVKHTATIGFRYHLNGGDAAPVVAGTPTVSDPAGPAEYIVFFGHNKADLTAAAIEVIKEAAAAAKDNGNASLKLVGHTDRSGSDKYNQALSLRRANVVKAALVAEGVAAGSISLDGKGESDPMVPTADGVREPQNRRVNITF